MSLRTRVVLILTASVLAVSADAFAQISDGPLLNLSPGRIMRNNAAFSSVHGVYLVIVDRPPGAPLMGRFLSPSGAPIGADFRITFEAGDPFLGWASIAFGGPAGDPVFLVTYLVAEGANPKYARFVRYVPGGTPTVSGPIKIMDAGSEWYASEKGQNVWTGQRWVVGSRVLPAGWTVPTPQVNLLDMAGNVSGPVVLGDGLDFYGSPALSCASNGVCLAIGFMAGIPAGYAGGTYARRFDGGSLGPIGPLFTLATGNPNEDQGVVYQAHLGRFLAQWFRGGGPGYIDTRLIGTDGSLSALDYNRGIGPNAGTNAIAYNATTRTSLLMTKWTEASLIVLELGDDGYPVNMNNTILITNWDGSVPDYFPSIASNDAGRSWLVTAGLAAGQIGKIIQAATPEVPDPTNLVQNGTFTSGLTGWTLISEPSSSDLIASVVSGVLNFYRLPLPAGTTGQGAIRQSLNAAVATRTPITASFDLGNSSTVRKRVTVSLHDAGFGDLYTCTFWLSAGAPMRTYRMITHTSRAWSNATITFYAGTTGAEGGTYRLDNVRVSVTNGEPVDRTSCVDPTTPTAGTGPDGGTMLTNGNFSGGLAPWTVFGQITYRISGGVLEFVRPSGTPAGVVLQATGIAVPLQTRLTLTLGLGNSSNVRKRVTVVVHDNDFSDFSDCTFWLEPGQGIGTYTTKLFATKAWTNATVAVYPADVDTAQWIRLDDVALRMTPSAALVGTECIEATGASGPSGPGTTPPGAGSGRHRQGPSLGQAVPRPTTGGSGSALGRRSLWQRIFTGSGEPALLWAAPIDLSSGDGTVLWFETSLARGPSEAVVEVTRDGVNWARVASVPPAEDGAMIAIDLSEFAGDVIYVRVVILPRQTPRSPLRRPQ